MSNIDVLARILIAQYFIIAGVINVLSYNALLGKVKAKGVPLARVALPCAIALQIVAPLLLFIPQWAAVGAGLLIVFTLVATLMFHAYWTMSGVERFLHLNLLLANAGMIGALILLMQAAG